MMVAKNTTKILAAAVAAVALAGTAQAGTWSTNQWDNDTDLLLDSSKTYTHAVAITAGTTGTEVGTTINGVSFTQYETAAWANAAHSGTGWSVTTCYGYAPYAPSAGYGPTGTESAKLSTGALISSSSGSGFTLTLSGLTENTDYIFTIYSAEYDSYTRTAYLDGLDDGVGNVRTHTMDNTQLQYAYTTGAGVTTFDLNLTEPVHGYYSLTAFTNEELGTPVEPSDGGTVSVKTIVLESKDTAGTIQWQASANGSRFTNLTGATSTELDVTALYPSTPWFRVEATNGGEPPDYSPSMKVTENVDGTVIMIQ